jgi:large subunit ribosomal protein L18
MVMKKRTIKRRRRENKTDYKLRLNLLKSNEKRIVIRTTNKYFIVSAVESRAAQDFVLKLVTSKDLLKQDWDVKSGGSLKSIPAGYLTGRLLAKEIGRGKYIIDIGMARTHAGCRVFSVVKGLIDGGLEINAKNSIFPSEERLAGEHLKPELKQMIERVLAKL